MKLKLTRSLRTKIKAIVGSLLFDIIDGDIDEVETLVLTLRTLADELEEQNS